MMESQKHSDRQLQQILMEWNNTAANFPKDKCIHELFEAQARRTPDATAIVFQGSSLTYAELEARANQLAQHLHQLGVKPETFVGLYLDRSIDVAVGLLAILKSGGAFVPLDSSYPAERLAFILQDARLNVILTHAELAPTLPSDEHSQFVLLDTDWATIAQYGNTCAEFGAKLNHAAYLIYTSGSTGKPKGVVVEHHSLVNHSAALSKYYDLQPTDCVLQFASITFDVALEEFFPAWISGAAVIMFPDPTSMSLHEFLRFIEFSEITVLNLPASYWHYWVAELSSSNAHVPSTIRLVIVGSERVLPSHLLTWHKLVGSKVRWINAYGPTECTITCIAYEYSGDGDKLSAVPVGRPISNVQVYVLDPEFQPVSLGEIGELYIAGEGVARGYLNQTALTDHHFIQHDVAGISGQRLYGTGDLACWQPDGNLQVLGRNDDQVKIRGFRIELGEIESVLATHPTIQDVAVIIHEMPPDHAQLIAYFVVKLGQSVTVAELKKFTEDRLPRYMIPDQFVSLASMPLTSSGKLDRKVLYGLKPRAGSAIVGASPQTAVHEMLQQIWLEVLPVDKVGIFDNFLEIGGHSLVAIQIISRIRQLFAIEISPRVLFEFPTIAELAEVIEKYRVEPKSTSLRSMTPAVRPERIPLSSSQERVWILNQLMPGTLAYNTQLMVEFKGDLDLAILEKALTEIVRRQEILRTTFHAADGVPYQQIHEPYPVTIPLFDVTQVAESEREQELDQIVRQYVQQTFDVGQLPLIKWALVKKSSHEHVLIQIEHHLIHDGWSLSVLLADIERFYNIFLSDTPVLPPDPSLQFSDFVLWERE